MDYRTRIKGPASEKGIYGFMNDITEFVPFDIKKVYYYKPKSAENFSKYLEESHLIHNTYSKKRYIR